MSKRITITVTPEMDKAISNIASALGTSKSQAIIQKLLSTRGFPRRDLNRFTRVFISANNTLTDDRFLLLKMMSSGNNSSIPTRNLRRVLKSIDKLNNSMNELRNEK